MTAPTDRILIVGCGCFGVSTAYHLLKRGYRNVTLLDRSPQLPAPDAASNDINRRANVELLESSGAIRSVFPEGIRTAAFEGQFAYLNKDGGWAFAGKGLKIMLEHVVQLGATVLPGKQVKGLVQDGSRGRTTGVDCYDGSKYEADLVIVATGSWTPSAFPDLQLDESCLATGQCVSMIQLTAEEAAKYQDCPVVLDFKSGFYVFPPNEDNIVKMAIHSAGYVHPINGISTPRTSNSDPQDGTAIPRAGLNELREQLRQVYPDLAEKPFSATRLCWYNDSPDGDWVISRYPGDEGLVFATAGSGHAFKVCLPS
ncbi:hypothetical protein H1R20_g8794, partial [Candolleomyces eurysporus]